MLHGILHANDAVQLPVEHQEASDFFLREYANHVVRCGTSGRTFRDPSPDFRAPNKTPVLPPKQCEYGVR